MKTKTKILAVAEIAIVLCSILLVALPAIAADQTTQKASASPSMTTYGHTDLDVFGNANEDDTIDMRDTTYIKLVIFGKKPKTDLADANNDGKVSMLDVGQTKLIILGKEKEITIVDYIDRVVTIRKPVEKVVCMHRAPEHLVAIGAKDKIAAARYVRRELVEITGLTDLPDVGSASEPNYERILEIMPDLITAPMYDRGSCAYEMDEHLPDEIPVVALDFYIPGPRSRSLRMIGYILDKENEVGELLDWLEKYLDMLTERTKDLEPEEKPTVLYIKGNDGKIETRAHGVEIVELYAGGRNIAYGIVPLGADSAEVSNEWILEQDPDVIFVHDSIGWEASNEDAANKLDEFIRSRPGWDKLSAVKDGRVYLTDWDLTIHRYSIGACYIAKCLHPELFGDLDPKEIHREYYERFMGFEVHQGVWMYPAAPE